MGHAGDVLCDIFLPEQTHADKQMGGRFVSAQPAPAIDLGVGLPSRLVWLLDRDRLPLPRQTSPKSCERRVRHLSGGLSFQKLPTVFQLDILQGSPVSLITRGEERAGDGSPPCKLLLGGASAVEANRGPELNLINIHYPGRSSLESKLLTRWMIRTQEGCEMAIQRRMSRAATMRRKHRGLVCQFHSASCTRPDVTPLKAWEVET